MAEPSGAEAATAALVADELRACRPAGLLTGLGGHGLAAVFDRAEPGRGPTVVLRAELDALPIHETIDLPTPRAAAGAVAHKCGHDGHMAILLGVAPGCSTRPPRRGRVVLLFQPAEETGEGAAPGLRRPALPGPRAPTGVFALHNLPGYPLGRVLLRAGAFCAGSVGLIVRLEGRHLPRRLPGAGPQPRRAMAGWSTEPGRRARGARAAGSLALVTVVHARLGERAFGTTPGEAEMHGHPARGRRGRAGAHLARGGRAWPRPRPRPTAWAAGSSWVEEFPVTGTMTRPCPRRARRRDRRSRGRSAAESPFRWSEDFGSSLAALDRGAVIGLGAGRRPAAAARPRPTISPTPCWSRACAC